MEKQTSGKKTAKGRTRKPALAGRASRKSRASTHYLKLIDLFPLRPIRSTSELDEAIQVLDRIQGWSRQLLQEEQDYLECLSHEIERYEAENVPMPAVSGAEMLRHLIDAREATLSEVAEGTGVALSTLSDILAKRRRLNIRHLEQLAPYFGVEPAVFLD